MRNSDYTELMSPGSPRLRVIHVALQLDTGGMEKLLVEFARHSDRARYDLHFVSLSTRGPVAAELEALGWPVTALLEPPGLRPGLVLRLAKLFRALQADVVHIHNTKPLIYAGPAARLARVARVIYTRHGQRHGATPRQNLLFRLAARTAHRIVCVSDDSARLSARDGLAHRRLVRIWNGIDVQRFAYLGPRSDGPAVMVGRLSPEKNVQCLLRAAAILSQQRPGFRLRIAGDGVCLPALRSLAHELKIQGQVTFLGNVNDVPSLLGEASVFVLPSLTEGISLTLLEAMARGLPVVATRVGGNPEVVADGQTGLLVRPDSPEQLASAIGRLLDDPAMARQMGEAGCRRVQRLFNVKTMVRQYECLYEGRQLSVVQSSAAADNSPLGIAAQQTRHCCSV